MLSYYFLTSLFLYLCFNFTIETPTVPAPTGRPRDHGDTIEAQLAYLQRYGYISSTGRSEISRSLSRGLTSSTMTYAIKAFQRMVNLPETGELDSATKTMMAKPRCGNKDVDRTTRRRRKRYELQGGKMSKTSLKWTLVDIGTDMDQKTQRNEIQAGFNLWAKHSPISLTHVNELSEANIRVGFYYGSHGDSYPFDGESGVLAHAFYPQNDESQIHFDEAEFWTLKTTAGRNLLTVAAHEMGHSLGLGHSDVNPSLMAPVYKPYIPYIQPDLDADDVAGIQALYGSPIGQTTLIPAENKNHCAWPYIDAVFSIGYVTFMFVDRKVVRIDSTYIDVTSWPKSVNSVFREMSDGEVNAAFLHLSTIYLFQGLYVYLYSSDRVFGGRFPISERFQGVTNTINGIFEHDNVLYMVQGAETFRMEPLYSGQWRLHYVGESVSFWGLPPDCNYISAGFHWINGYTYIFCGYQYVRLERNSRQVFDHDTQPYPREVAYWWLGCSRTSGSLVGSTLIEVKELASSQAPEILTLEKKLLVLCIVHIIAMII